MFWKFSQIKTFLQENVQTINKLTTCSNFCNLMIYECIRQTISYSWIIYIQLSFAICSWFIIPKVYSKISEWQSLWTINFQLNLPSWNSHKIHLFSIWVKLMILWLVYHRAYFWVCALSNLCSIAGYNWLHFETVSDYSSYHNLFTNKLSLYSFGSSVSQTMVIHIQGKWFTGK